MTLFKRLFLALAVLVFCPVMSKQLVVREDKFVQNQGWPDVYWLKDFQVAVEECVKKSVALGKKNGAYPTVQELSDKVSGLFEDRSKVLDKIVHEFEHTGAECLYEFELGTQDLHQWFKFLLSRLSEVKTGMLKVVEKHHSLAKDKKQWLAQPGRLQLEVRRVFNDFFSSLDRPWAAVLPDLLNFQTNPDHSEIMEKRSSTSATSMKSFLKFELPKLWDGLNKSLSKDFRDARRLESCKARLEFYGIATRLSETVRHFEFVDLCAISDKEYEAIYKLVTKVGDAVITRVKQMQYDERDFSFYVQKSIWILMYWFYNIFPYKNYPWEDENCLKIENLFKLVSSKLNLGEPYQFCFNCKGRHKYKNPNKERVLGVGPRQKR